jgi:serine phosphatase RsbU (regulator of sigma subunit)/Tfp pilus assembly protein PilF
VNFRGNLGAGAFSVLLFILLNKWFGNVDFSLVMNRIFLLISIFFLVAVQAWGQRYASRADSLVAQLSTQEDTFTAITLNELCWELKFSEPEKAKDYGQQALALSEKLQYTKGIVRALTRLGVVHVTQGEQSEALDYFMKALQLNEKTGNLQSAAAILNNIGIIYKDQRKFDDARTYFNKSLNYYRQLKHLEGEATALNNIGVCYQDQGQDLQAQPYFEKALTIFEQLKKYAETAGAYDNIGLCYLNTNRLNEAERYFQKALTIRERIENDQDGIASTLHNLANLEARRRNWPMAKQFASQSLAAAQKINALNRIRDSHQLLSDIYRGMGNFQEALVHFRAFTAAKDSLSNRETSDKLSRLQHLYELEKHRNQIQELKSQNAKISRVQVAQGKQLETERLMRYGLMAILPLMVGAVAVFWWGKRQQQRNTTLLQRQYEEINIQRKAIEDQRNEIAKKNHDIESSINYARRIQEAMLPKVSEIGKLLPDSFVFFRPRDIVSGDFYWFTQTAYKPVYTEVHTFTEVKRVFAGFRNKKEIFAAIDCTGHGVPGAFMSMIGNEQLNEIVLDHDETQADKILNRLHRGVRQALRQADDQLGDGLPNRDGMDMALCVIDQTDRTVQFAGAKNPLLYIQNGEAILIKGDKMPIGGFQKEKERLFTAHLIHYQSPTAFYMFSDGFQDQFGGTENKKFSFKQLQQLLLNIYHLPMPEQHRILEKTFLEWKGPEEQIDDVLVVGFRLGA